MSDANIARLQRAMDRAGEPPCTVHRCERIARCAASGAACTAFALFAASGKVTPPTPETATETRLQEVDD